MPRPPLREYQERIVIEVLGRSAIVRLPTGSGKTILAAEVIARVGGRAVFLVPKIILVQQQARAVREWLAGVGSGRELVVAELHGEIAAQLPAAFDVLVTTPAAFAISQKKQGETHSLPGGSLQWGSFRLLVIDEVHHVLKDHPYRKLALDLVLAKTSTPNVTMPHVLGLSASLTYEFFERAMEQQVRAICKELGVTKVCSASPAELESGGYRSEDRFTVKVVPETRTADTTGVLPHAARAPHRMLPLFLRRVASSTATPFTLRAMAVVEALEAAITILDPTFEVRELKALVACSPPRGS